MSNQLVSAYNGIPYNQTQAYRHKQVSEANNSTWLRCQGHGCSYMTQDKRNLSPKHGLCMNCLEQSHDNYLKAKEFIATLEVETH